jgi:3-oxoacyl-[acyl-carrier-protein] synthase-1/3-oxoacyl-[acyl-carrier-protein] synthase II
MRVFVTSLGIISPLGKNATETLAALSTSACGLAPLSLFPSSIEPPLPAGEIKCLLSDDAPRTHNLALIAAREAMAGAAGPPDAIVVGVTTGGMTASEPLLKSGAADPNMYSLHGVGTVAQYVAEALGCQGPVLTVSTACSSSMAVLKLAVELLRNGRARRVLAGGADGLCRLTYYGFNSLQLVDPAGARPFDKDRRGMSLGEGSAMLILEAAAEPPAGTLAEVLGIGLSCDAYHPAAPHPEGAGALRAMRQALSEAGLQAAEIEYVNLHGTGTPDNDLAEARAVQALFGQSSLPPVSSVKGAIGHTLGAAGAVNAAVSVLCIHNGIIPATTGCLEPDPALLLRPVAAPLRRPVKAVLSNAFGFGGNNASIVLGKPAAAALFARNKTGSTAFAVLGSACLTGSGNLAQTMQHLTSGKTICGMAPAQAIMQGLQESAVRRLKRLPRMVLSIAAAACEGRDGPAAMCFGTGWGGLSETNAFLDRLFATQERFTSPTDFIGSVHNAPAGQAAMQLQAQGANLTLTDGDYSFEQALFSAGLIAHEADGPLLVMGADEYHEKLTPLFDPSATCGVDGGGALLLRPVAAAEALSITPVFLSNALRPEDALHLLIHELGGTAAIEKQYGAIFAGIPAARHAAASEQLKVFLEMTRCTCPVIDYRKITGEFASAAAVAAVIALECVRAGAVPAAVHPAGPCLLHNKAVLLLGLGRCITAVEIRG